MSRLTAGWRIQRRVVSALMLRELVTRFGRENIGFLWIMAEPLLFAMLVGLLWRFMKGPEEHGVSVIAFVATGYIPLTLFRQSLQRSVKVFSVNGSLLYHRQIQVLDFILVRFLVEMVGAMMAYFFIAVLLITVGEFPVPANLGIFLVGWFYYAWFTLALVLCLAPLSEKSEILEKLVPLTTYIAIPFSGTFNMMSWLTPPAQAVLWYSPFVHAMEMMRDGIFGNRVDAEWGLTVPTAACLSLTLLGLILCQRIRRHLVIE
ncbi:ABC transporter permease [Sphingomonas sp. BN140010]|uniref:ABC transporter permease n=1 Tax=Sphingomonas arvum TaxID=2992113 RepID=A0ABT3JC68_9SPHN|nr:ABC transporter permease [Sphingomonas sp. BN140010]MCW3796672.1 ABC transporter permease [Sphingomonas sp. BN140010]